LLRATEWPIVLQANSLVFSAPLNAAENHFSIFST
jgi:hypothetical protein